MANYSQLPIPVIDALPLGAHRLPALTDEALFASSSVRIAFTGRDGGTSTGPFAGLNCGSHVGDDLDTVMRNRRLVCEAVGMPDAPLVVPRQVHGTKLVYVSRGSEVAAVAESADEGADGVIVMGTGVGALLNFADCLPLIIVSPSGRFAVVHAGWRGAVGHIAAKTAKAMERDDGVAIECYNAYIGPHIRQECFEVGEDVMRLFKIEFGSAVIDDERHVSLAEAVMVDLCEAGLRRERIADANICTKCHSNSYYSYRASGGNCGRHAAFAIKTG